MSNENSYTSYTVCFVCGKKLYLGKDDMQNEELGLTKEPQSIQHLDYSVFEIVKLYSQKCNTYYHRYYENSCCITRDKETYNYGEFLTFDIVRNKEIIISVIRKQLTPDSNGVVKDCFLKQLSYTIPKLKVINNIIQIISTFRESRNHLEYIKNLLEKL